MVPMIDLMVCCISFLLITAVWSHMARVDSSALVPGDAGLLPAAPERRLHVDARTRGKFTLTWKQGPTVISTLDVLAAGPENTPGEHERHTVLGATIADEWRAHGSHRDPNDRAFDQAVLHTGDTMPFGDIVAIIDAIHAPHRRTATRAQVPALNVVYAAD
jgi:hypothetical protein